VENLNNPKHILIKTRRVEAYSKLAKIKYMLLLTSLLVNNNFTLLSNTSIYKYYILNEVTLNHWKFYLSIVPTNLGLVMSNHHKSVLYKTFKNIKLSLIKFNNYYFYNFELYQFYFKKDIFKKLIILYMSILPLNYLPYNINFNIYNGYVWLNWYLRLNPLNNVFYLKIYNY
jgi:hypothetical protein